MELLPWWFYGLRGLPCHFVEFASPDEPKIMSILSGELLCEFCWACEG